MNLGGNPLWVPLRIDLIYMYTLVTYYKQPLWKAQM